MTYHFRAFLLGLALLTLSIFICFSVHTSRAATNNKFPVEVRFPAKYTYSDGTVLATDQYTGTKVMYGTCDENTEIGELLGEAMAPSTSNKTEVFYVPSQMELCFVAVVLDLDGQPLGKSNPAKFSTFGPRPSKPVNVFAQ